MKRILTEKLFNQIIELLLEDEKVKIFQELLMTEKVSENTENQGGEK